MGQLSRQEVGGIDVAECIHSLEDIRGKCDQAGHSMIAIHLTQAIELLKVELASTDEK